MVFYSTNHIGVKNAELVPHVAGTGRRMPQLRVLQDVVRQRVSELIHVVLLLVERGVFFNVVEQAAKVGFVCVGSVEFSKLPGTVRHIQGMLVAGRLELVFENGFKLIGSPKELCHFLRRQGLRAGGADVRCLRRLAGHFPLGVCRVFPGHFYGVFFLGHRYNPRFRMIARTSGSNRVCRRVAAVGSASAIFTSSRTSVELTGNGSDSKKRNRLFLYWSG